MRRRSSVSSRRRRRGMAAGLIVAVAAGGAAYGGWVASGGGAGQQDPRRVAAVEAAFRHAVQADESFGSPSAAYRARVMAAIHAHRQPFALSAAELRLLLASGTAAIARYFSSAQTSVEQTHLNDGLALDSNPNIVNLGSGVSLVKFLHVAITGARATVEANVTVWARSEARQASSGPWLMTDPVNIVDDKATLARSPSGTWQVTSLTGEPVPGYGP